MPANMMKAAVGSSEKVTGSSSATAIAEPSPGQDAYGGAEQGADQYPEEVNGGQCAGEAAHEEFELFH
jgi:hypothetical protein